MFPKGEFESYSQKQTLCLFLNNALETASEKCTLDRLHLVIKTGAQLHCPSYAPASDRRCQVMLFEMWPGSEKGTLVSLIHQQHLTEGRTNGLSLGPENRVSQYSNQREVEGEWSHQVVSFST